MALCQKQRECLAKYATVTSRKSRKVYTVLRELKVTSLKTQNNQTSNSKTMSRGVQRNHENIPLELRHLSLLK
jgi:hypothetical protein